MHIPVLQNEVIEYLAPGPNDNFIDCTVNGGGHTLRILKETQPKGKVLAIDADSEILSSLKEKLKEQKLDQRVVLANDNFSNLKEIVEKEKFKNIKGILFDLGFSSWHLESSGRGFTFLKSEPLDMRYSLKAPLTASKILNFWSEQEIERILRDYGEERFAGQIAKEIIRQRRVSPIENTFQLVNVLKRTIPLKFQRQHIHFATRTFQALRIAVNDELQSLKKALKESLEILDPKGRLVVISFHSLEDRIVKNFFKDNKVEILTKKPIIPQKTEVIINPRSRSSKLRAAIKT